MRNKRRMVSYFEGFNPPLKEMFIEDAFELVKNGAVKDTIEQLRLAKQKGLKNKCKELKKGLPSFTPSATYIMQRNKDSVKDYSNIISLDYDDISLEEVNEIKQIICNQNEAYACFVSPSGDGLKVFVKTDNGEESHEIAFKQVKEYFDKIIGYEADKGCKDITRLCYLSFDKELYLNKESTEYAIDISKKPIEIKTAKISTGQVAEGNRNQFLTSVGGAMIRKGISQTAILSALLEENKVKCVPPLDDEEVNAICDSICKYEPTDPITPNLKQEKPFENDFYNRLTDNIITRFINIVSPHSESSIMGLLFSFLTCFGNLIGRNLFHKVEGDKHHCNLFICLVGGTSTGRKGTSWGRVKSIFEMVDANWIKYNIKGGLYTGEGLIFAVRNPKPNKNKKKPNIDEGVKDKRLLALQTEFSSVLNLSKGESNIISTVLRDAWDGGVLTTLIKNKRDIATNAHISIIGHITPSELRSSISKSDLSNGFANRFLWVYVEMTKELPFGGYLDENLLKPIVKEIKEIVEWVKSKHVLEMVWDDDAKQTWIDAYSDLVKDFDGELGKVTSRAAPQVLRLTMILAVLDKDNKMKKKHLEMALLLWQYSLKSADYVFGNKIDSGVQNKILIELQMKSTGLTKTQVFQIFNNHTAKDVIDSTISYLIQTGKVSKQIVATNSKPKTIYKIVENLRKNY